MMRSKKMLGSILLFITAMIWGTAFAFQRVGMDSIEPISFTASRMLLATVAIGAFALGARKRKRGNPASPYSRMTAEEKRKYDRQTVLGGICCGFFLATASVTQQMGLVTTTAGKAGFITAMYILLVPVFGFILFRKKNTLLVWLAVLIGVFGMYLLCATEGFRLTRGDTLVVICAVLYSFHILSCDHFVQRGDPLMISALQFLTCFLLSTVFALLLEAPTWDKIRSAAIPILYCGLISGGIGYTLQILGQKHTEPAIASLIMSLESVFAVIGGALILQERMSMREAAGCAVLFLAIILAQLPTPKKDRQKF